MSPLGRTATRLLVVFAVVFGIVFAVWVSFYLVNMAKDPEVQARAARIRAQQAQQDSARAAQAQALRTPRIQPVRPIPALREEALAATPPQVDGAAQNADLVDLRTLDSTLRFDIRYATSDNFLSTPIYQEPGAFLQRPAAEALVRAHQALTANGYGLIVYDAYRPWHVTKMFWEATPDSLKEFVADPDQGSRHNRGAAVDVGLYDLATGQPVAMQTAYDDFTPQAYAEALVMNPVVAERRTLLFEAMSSEGFTVLPAEWWHFDYEGWENYPILNEPFGELNTDT